MAALGLSVQAAVLSARGLDAAALACVRMLVARLPAESAWLALGPGPALRLLAASDAGGGDAQRAERRLAACAEVVDQAAVVALPPPGTPGAVPRIHRALRRAVGDADWGLGLPLVADGRVIGALGLVGRGRPQLPADTRQALEHIACLLGPVLELIRLRDRRWRERLRDALWPAPSPAAAAAGSGPAPAARLRRVAWIAVLAALLVMLAWPVALPIGGPARLEGSVQRRLSAPSDGFVQRVWARPGESVRAGQPLLELADQDLLLERQRWQSQLAQQRDALAAAQARADRALLVQAQARADEARAQLDLVDERLARSRVLAPFDGLLVQGDLSQRLGAPVRQGEELMVLAADDRFRVVVEIDERDIGLVRAGLPGGLTLTALPWQTLPLTVRRIDPVARSAEGRQVFEVDAELAERPPGLRPGLVGLAQIEVGEASLGWRWFRRAAERLRLLAWSWFG